MAHSMPDAATIAAGSYEAAIAPLFVRKGTAIWVDRGLYDPDLGPALVFHDLADAERFRANPAFWVSPHPDPLTE